MNSINIIQFYSTTLKEFTSTVKIIEQLFPIKKNKKEINSYICTWVSTVTFGMWSNTGTQERRFQTNFLKDQTVDILGFAGHLVSGTTTQLCCCSTA